MSVKRIWIPSKPLLDILKGNSLDLYAHYFDINRDSNEPDEDFRQRIHVATRYVPLVEAVINLRPNDEMDGYPVAVDEVTEDFILPGMAGNSSDFPQLTAGLKCECGADSVNGGHSIWCQKFEK